MKNYLALKASAGSGKTFALTVRYICLLLFGAKPNEILTLTFTNKAANEMSERIYKTLLTLGDDEAYLNAIENEVNLSKEEILGKKNILIKQFSNANLSIFTIDKFVNKILREFCGYIGISDDFEIKNDDIEKLSYEFLKSLNEKDFQTLIDLSFYEKKKFNSIFELFKTILEKNEDIEVINIDASLIELQKENILKEAFKIKESILSCTNASNSAKNAVDFETFEDLFGRTWLEKENFEDYSYFKKCANESNKSDFFKLKEELSIYYKIRAGFSLNKIFEVYLKFKDFKFEFNKNKNYLEFNDISNLVYDLLSTKIDKDFLYFRLDSNYSHILIDEFQDTSLLQYKILEPLIDEILSGDVTKFKTFFYVGDTKQSIYRFRGGKRELFDYVANTNKILEVEVLNTNYRSCENVINFVNELFLNLPNYEYFKQESVRTNGYVEVIKDTNLEEEEKFVNIAEKIEELLQNGVNFNDIAILTYTNDDVLSLYYYLKQKFPSIKISTEMTSKLINQQNVKAVINAIKYIYFKEEIYKENLNAIIGNKLLTTLDLEIILEEKSVQEVIKELSKKLKIIDENIIKLIEVSSSFNNIVDFVYEIDKLEAIMENSESKGLQILTIFKSKGLEFHTVILLDRIKRKNVDKSSLLFDYENLELKNIFYKIKGYENFNEDYKKAIDKEKKLSLEDEINILYVAMTRAKNNMIIFKKEKSSVFDILNMNVCKIGKMINSSNLVKNIEEKSIISYTPLNLGIQEKQIVKEKELKENHLHSRYFGLATHYCLEMLNNFSFNDLKYTLNLAKTRFSNYLSDKDFTDIENRLAHLINNDFFKFLITNSVLTSEQSLIYKEELKIIDLLIYKDDTYYILDYKTTKEELDEEHKNQVLYYKEAIKEIFKTSNVKSYLVYLKMDNCLMYEI
ncbi:RecB-like helicase [Aliarcobacter butzleri]|uniref:DNA 3'-5' helicase n=1 Tax=Aliarcobacter butzleri TaxID=28197 RepID=A0AAP4UXE3_9BACT|nr:RecB-like helicase [Aliarcobacter butzleri]MDN5050905.1 RecB-like helicase [Aliarcobacter butzleri]MDN5074488.1 RecB-like helicase [Aliarcobacter butzleri]MDN5115408.1 RecB-like helicase [Aliarcobacter butzleri]MDN5131178.1 RecB-like helicase [Aliarcobacter butzleri]NUW25302.1 RecB-like helicase [Aliarcobacter butzleri]